MAMTYRIHEYKRIKNELIHGLAATVIGTQDEALTKAKSMLKKFPDRMYKTYKVDNRFKELVDTIGHVELWNEKRSRVRRERRDNLQRQNVLPLI